MFIELSRFRFGLESKKIPSYIVSAHALTRVTANERDHWLRGLFLVKYTGQGPQNQRHHHFLTERLVKWILCAWSTSGAFTMTLLIQCFLLFPFPTPTVPLSYYPLICKMSLILMHSAPSVRTSCTESHLSASCELMRTQQRCLQKTVF